MIYKFALTDTVSLKMLSGDENGSKLGMVRTASGRVMIEPNSEKSKIVEAEISKHPNSLFFRAKAIEANCPNSNGDYFSEEELVRACKTFEGVPFFTNHDNQNIENARGKIIFAEWIPEEKAIYTIAFVDRDAYPHICRSIEEEYVTGVSMGCSVEYSVCNICGNRAEKTEDYCTHIKNRKGRKFTGRARNVTTGETKDFRDEKVFEYNHGIKFIELSAVVDPACPSCHIQGIIPNEDYLKRVANIENSFYMIKTAAMEKNASKEEIDQMEGVLKTLEEFSVNLIKNRKQVEMSFATELVEILSDLQEWLDELIGAGYGNLDEKVPGTTDEVSPTETPTETPTQTPAQTPAAPALPPSTSDGVVGAVPAASSTPVGKTSGTPGNPPVASPKLPITAPLKPRAMDGRSIQRIADYRVETGKEVMLKAASLCEKMNKTGDIDMAKRRTIAEKMGQITMAKEVLSNSWKEKQDFFEYISKVPSVQDNENKLSVKKRDDSFIIVAERKNASENSENEKNVWTYEDLTREQKDMIKEFPRKAAATLLETFSKSLTNKKEGENRMTDIKQKAGATTVNAVPDVVTEKQLEQKGLFHSRTNQEADQVTQAQLDALRANDEKDVVTEKQLSEKIKLNPRTGVEADEVQEAQLANLRENKDLDQVTQAQLEANRVNNEPDVVTEKQLNNTSAPWARSASTFRSASDHLTEAIKVMAHTSITSGCTPEEVCEVCASLVDTVKNRSDLATSIVDGAKPEADVDYSKRLAFWSNKNLKVASAGKKEIAKILVDGLRVVASDKAINPEVLINAVDVIGEGGDAIPAVAKKIDEQLKLASSAKTTLSVKAELRKALASTQEAPKATKEQRDAERAILLASIEETQVKTASQDVILNKVATKNADTVIETNFGELGCSKKDPSFRNSIKSFAKGALASQNIKLAAITNVTISGDTIQIAVQTDEGDQSVEIPVGDTQAPAMDETVPEGDLSGEGLENTLGTPASSPAHAPTATASSKKMTKVAQSPMGGGVPGTPGGASASGDSSQGLPGSTPGGDAIQALTTDPSEKDESVPTVGEQQMPWTICPECGTSDVDVTNEEGDIKGKCNNPECGAEYEAMVKKEIEFKIIKPSKAMSGEGTAETPEAPTAEAEVPALPVAAQTRIDKGAIVRIGKNKEKHGHVCPACGKTKCEASKDKEGHTEFTCDSCKTVVEKDVLISSKNPDVAFLRVKWDLFPKAGCKGCDEKVAKFASKIKIEKLLRTASNDFPMANCLERVARTYGGNTVGTFGPCKGKALADCVCNKLKSLALTKVKHLNKFAEVSTQVDPMDECVKDQEKKGYKVAEAKDICGCLKKKVASSKNVKPEDLDNAYAQAFADEVTLSATDLVTLHEMDVEASKEIEMKKLATIESEEIGADLPALTEAEVEVEVIKESKETVNEIKEAKKEMPFCAKCKKGNKDCSCDKDGGDDKKDKKDKKETDEDDKKDKEDKKDEDMEKEAMSMNGQRIRKSNEEVLKMASTPKKIESIEGNVEAGVPRSEAYMGKEKEADSMINKTPAKPNVPRGNAYMGKENEADSMINKELKLPDVAVDSSYMGHEQEIQKGMPAINNEIKGTVIANDEKVTKEAKKMKEVDSVEGDVEAKVPRGKATIGNEGKDNIDVDMAKPKVPRSDAYMGNEKDADSLINTKLEGPDVPIDDSYMGHEKEVQKGMPKINDEMLKNVPASREGQMERIAKAREQKARTVVSWLVANKRLASDMETFENTIKALSTFEIDKISTVAEKMFPERSVRTASTETRTVEAGHALPAIVLESKSNTEDGLESKLSKMFTIGNSKFDHDLTMYGNK